jgi:phosphoadenosine phosphosulfate reductase
MLDFLAAGPFYVGTSWGKDSLVVAHLVAELRLNVPVIWFPAGPVENPDCALVREAFLARHDVRYIEHEVSELAWKREGLFDVHDGAQAAFARASKRFGGRYASGVRAEESRARRMRMAHWGECSLNTCAPIGFWKIEDVYAYLASRELPVHPAYACTWGGQFPRETIRVSTIGGVNGNGGLLGGNGRREWEESYYPETVKIVKQLADAHNTRSDSIARCISRRQARTGTRAPRMGAAVLRRRAFCA